MLCHNPYVLYTHYGIYYCSALVHYAWLTENIEPELQNIIKSFKRSDNDYCINVWANIWRFTIDIALNHGFNVIAFEPSPYTYHNFRINTVLSNIEDKIESYNIWLWNTNSDLLFATGERCDTMAHFIEDNELWTKKMSWKIWKKIKIPVKRFDDLWISDRKIKNTRLVIIDTEWFEFNVLMWMKESLKKFNNVKIIVEIWEHKKEKEEIISFMKWLWYEVQQLDREDYLFIK